MTLSSKKRRERPVLQNLEISRFFEYDGAVIRKDALSSSHHLRGWVFWKYTICEGNGCADFASEQHAKKLGLFSKSTCLKTSDIELRFKQLKFDKGFGFNVWACQKKFVNDIPAFRTIK